MPARSPTLGKKKKIEKPRKSPNTAKKKKV